MPMGTPAPNNEQAYDWRKDKWNCSFYMRTGACRYGNSCSKIHPVPAQSKVIVIHGFYSHGLGLAAVHDKEDDDLEYEESERYKHFEEFFYDVLPELERHGKISVLHICENNASHLRGNAIIEYETFEAAERALEAMGGRYYAGRSLVVEFCPIQDWRQAVCGMHSRGTCPWGKKCNFLHVYKNPRGLYGAASRGRRPDHYRPQRDEKENNRRYRQHDRHRQRPPRDNRSRDRRNERRRSRSRDRSRKRRRDISKDRTGHRHPERKRKRTDTKT
mmetsp:Transcript_11048/g.12148  ORF Transcript_11048/g.12148 Transcript_11048/m.12148 type:complete len:274 (+) Transcript_11048:280-1101(+)